MEALPAGVVLVNMTFDGSTRFNGEPMHIVGRLPDTWLSEGPIVKYPAHGGYVAVTVGWEEDNHRPTIRNLPEPKEGHIFVVEKEVYLVAKLLFPERKDLRFPSGELVFDEKYEDCLVSFTALGHFDL